MLRNFNYLFLWNERQPRKRVELGWRVEPISGRRNFLSYVMCCRFLYTFRVATGADAGLLPFPACRIYVEYYAHF